MSAERRSDGALLIATIVLAVLVLLPLVMMAVAVPVMGRTGTMGW